MTGHISSIQTLGTVDGPGVRFVIFMQGCPLRCIYCHNPETWNIDGGTTYEANELFEKIKRYKDYFSKDGGITVSGGEPLLQAKFLVELFTLCRNEGINTCLDTSGSLFNDDIKELLSLTNLVLLDIKMTTNELYKKNCGVDLDKVISFLDYLEEKQVNTWIRHVIVKDITTKDDSLTRFKKIISKYTVIRKIELLPFRKLCLEKYDELNIEFKLKDTPETTDDEIKAIEEYLKK